MARPITAPDRPRTVPPKPAPSAAPVRTDLPESPALSILKNPPESFKGRKLGILVSDGVDAELLEKLQSAFAKEGATSEIIAPKVGGVKASDGSKIVAKHMIDGGPSVLFDAVALLLTLEGAELLALMIVLEREAFDTR